MNDINLLPQYVLIQRRNAEMMKEALIWGLVIIIASIVICVLEVGQKLVLEIDINQLKSEIGSLQQYKKDNDLLKKLQADIKSKEQIEKDADANGQEVLDLLSVIEQQTPKSVIYNDVAIDTKAKKIAINGKAPDIYAITDLVNSLNSGGVFSEAFAETFKADKQEEGMPFNLSIKYDLGGGKSDAERH